MSASNAGMERGFSAQAHWMSWLNDLVERLFSRFVEPIHRSHGDINETEGDGLMIIFKEGDILIAEETGKIIDGLWPVYDRGTTTLKGIDHPVHVIRCSEPHELF